MQAVFLHVDLDAFFASVEQLDHPEYRGKPVIVGGLPGERRAVVSTASYEARRFGVHSAMPVYQAFKLCPNGIYLHGRMKRYHEKSEEVMNIFKNYSPDIQQISVDEAFIDLTGTEKLFGPPIETAKRLKAEVKEKTGLTVSVGLASTKYCAKIASGLQKPDGLTVVPAGQEEDFMLSLPITKIWGAGNKTIEKLANYGLKTPRDIYNRSEALLQSLFGKAAGSFLYNSVRGNPGVDFHAEPKSRSLSAENTYEYDLTDIDIIETALLGLCHTVMFRSLREKVRSSTVCVKIRYEDFTTVSVQAASERYVSSVDDLFERAKGLLEKKRDVNKGIRLLGLGLQNLEDEDAPRQLDLFDFGEEKKRKLESAILKAQEKNPSLKITKARLLGTSTLILSMLFFPLQEAKAENGSNERDADGAAGIVFDSSKLPLSSSGNLVPLFDSDFGNQDIEFYASGYWKSEVTGGASGSFGFGLTPSFSPQTPVFSQNVDLSLFFLLNHHWYFEAAFADEFTQNTVAAGYTGEGYLKSARVSNRKIAFPSIYSVSDLNRGIGGDSQTATNQAPGISLNWQGEKWRADAALRYDMLEAHEKSWYGKNSLSVSEIDLSAYDTGKQYILPKGSLVENIKDVYVESTAGSYTDSKGRKYKKIDESSYLLMASSNMLLLSKDAKASRRDGVLPALAVTFRTNVSQSDFGDYDDESSFLGKVQKWFQSNNKKKLKLKNYSYPLFNSINGEDCLFLQYPSGFSPFMVSSRYDCGSGSASDCRISDKMTGTTIDSYSVVIDEDNISFASTDFFYSNHLYADVSVNDSADNMDSESDEESLLIRSAFPLAAESPGIYLGNSDSILGGMVLQVRTFTAVKRLEIGTNAVEGTITVYRNGVMDSGARYDPESGTITLSGAVSSSDHITARWYEDSEDSDSGAIAAAAGFKYEFTDGLESDLSASARWSMAKDRDYADSSYASQGYATLASKTSFTGERFSISNISGFSYENTNTTGIYRILGNDDSENESYYFSKKAGIDLPEGFAPCLNEKKLDGSSQVYLEQAGNASLDAREGISDSGISGYAIPLEWDFSAIGETGAKSGQLAWCAISLYTSGLSGILTNSSVFSIALKNSDFQEEFDSSNCALYLQLGVSEDEDFSFEESEKIPTWKISDSGAEEVKSAFSFGKEGWQTVTVRLSDEDRSVISYLQNFNARLILCTSDTASMPQSGAIYAGPYEAGELVFLADGPEGVETENYQERDSGLSASKVKELNPSSTNYVQHFEWKFQESPESTEEISFVRYFSEVDLSEYKKLSFFLKAYKAESVQISLSRQTDSGSRKAVVYEIKAPSDSWKEYTIDLSGSLNQELTCLDKAVLPTKLSIKVCADEDGFMSFDELYLSESQPSFTAQDKIKTSYKIEGAVFGEEKLILNQPILKDFDVNASMDGTSSFKNDASGSKEKNLSSTGSLNFTLMGIEFSSQAKLSNAHTKSQASDIEQKNALASASHRIQNESPLLGIFDFTESYAYSAEDGSLEKDNRAKIDLSSYFLPLSIEGSTSASSDAWALSQNSTGKLSFRLRDFNFSAESKISQKVPVSSADGQEKFETENYFSSWKKATDFSFDGGRENASKRKVRAEGSMSYSFIRAKFSPRLFFETEGSYKSSSKISFTDSSKTGLELPFTIGKNNFSCSWNKSGGSTALTEKGGSYEKDLAALHESLAGKKYFFASLPIYDLVSGELSEKVYESRGSSSYYTGAYTFSWKRAFFANKYDFFLPQSAKLEASRDIRTGTSTSDFYQLKNTANYAALNIFGRSGTLPIFSFFSNDEYNASLSAAAKIPRGKPENYTYIYSGYVQSTFYFTQENYLKSGFEGNYEGQDDWKAKYTLIWRRRAKSSLAKGAVSIFSEKKAEGTLKITKKDSFNLSLSESSSTTKVTKRYSADYSHETETQLSKYISLNTGTGLSYYALWNKSVTLTATASVGATIKF